MLPHALASPQVLSDVLSRTRNLRKLEYDYSGFWSTGLDADILSSSLINVQDTLVHLSLPLRGWDAAFVPFEQGPCFSISGYCSLKHMVALRTVDISVLILLGWEAETGPSLSEVLPPNLTNVRIRGECFDYDFIESVQEDVMNVYTQFIEHEHWRVATPSLRCFAVFWEEWEAKDTLQCLCNNNSLVCLITDREDAFPLPGESE